VLRARCPYHVIEKYGDIFIYLRNGNLRMGLDTSGRDLLSATGMCVCVRVCPCVNDAGIEMEVINSCASGNGGCEHLCHHSNIGITCSCHDGYTLKLDRKSCEGITLLTLGTMQLLPRRPT